MFFCTDLAFFCFLGRAGFIPVALVETYDREGNVWCELLPRPNVLVRFDRWIPANALFSLGRSQTERSGDIDAQTLWVKPTKLNP